MDIPRADTSRSYNDDDKTGDAIRKLDAIEIATQKLMRNMFELELHQAMARETAISLRMKEKEVANEKRKFEELQYQRWSNMNDFCDRIWKFSAKNDLCNLFNKYLDMPKKLTSCKTVAIDKDPEVLKLRSEVDELKKQLASKKAHALCLEEKVMQAKIQLQIVESYREKDPEIIRLTKNVEKYQVEVSTLENKILAIEKTKYEKRVEPFSSPFSSDDKKKHFITATELIAQEEHKDMIKKSKFSVKKESAISRKLADTRGTDRGN